MSTAFAALSHRDFRRFAGARFASTLAVQMMFFAVGPQVYALTHRKIDLAYVGLAQFLPMVCLSILAGQLADRVDRRITLTVCSVLFAACAAALYLIARGPLPPLAPILAVVAVVGATRAFYGPAASSLLPALVPREELPKAVTVQSTLWQIGAIAGPSLGGLLYGRAGAAGPVYLASAAALLLTAMLFPTLHARGQALDRKPATVGTALAGARYVAAHKILLGCISLDFFAVFFGGATALLPVFAADVLHVGADELGIMRAAPAAGAGIMAVALSIRPLGGRAGVKLLAAVATFGAATLVFALSQSYVLSVAALVITGAADMVSVVVRGTLLQQATPPEMRGRVSAVNMMFVGASNELGEFESGATAQWFGTVPAAVIGGAGTLAVVALWALGFPQIRRVDRLEDVRPDDVAPQAG